MVTLIVSSAADSGANTLRNALEQAEANGTGADLIIFSGAMAGQKVILSSTLNLANTNVVIDGDIDGDGAADVEITGDQTGDGAGAGDLDRLFDIDGTANVTLRSLKISGAYSRGVDGSGPSGYAQGTGAAVAGIFNRGVLTIEDAILSDFKSQGWFAQTGAPNPSAVSSPPDNSSIAGIVNQGGILTLTDSRIAGMKAYGGGNANSSVSGGEGMLAFAGVANNDASGKVYSERAIFSANYAIGGTGGDGVGAGATGGNGGRAAVSLGDQFDSTYGTFILDAATNQAIGGAGGAGDPAGTAGMSFDYFGLGYGTNFFKTPAVVGLEGGGEHTTGLEETFIGLQGNDEVTDTGLGSIFTGAGNDMITIVGDLGNATRMVNAGSGNDAVIGIVGANTELDGGSGTDGLGFMNQNAGFTFNLETGAGTVTPDEGAGFAASGVPIAFTATGFELFYAAMSGSHSDNIVGSSGANLIATFGENDIIRGAGGNDIIVGGGGNDRLFGDAGNDQLLGEGGRDVLNGGGGKDKITFGRGADKATGGGGKDQFIFKKQDGKKNSITDFKDRQDKINLKDFNFKNKKKALKEFTDAGGANNNKVIFNDKGTKVVIKGIDLDDLNGADILI